MFTRKKIGFQQICRTKTIAAASSALFFCQSINAQIFSDFLYQGNDKIYKENPLEKHEFYSPILPRS